MARHPRHKASRHTTKPRTGLKLRTGIKAGSRDTARYGDRYI